MAIDTISWQLSDFYSKVAYEDIPSAISLKAKEHILDTLGAGIAGCLSDEQCKLLKVLRLLGRDRGNAPVWGSGRLINPLDAALANGLGCHTFELDDTGGCDHSGAVVVPAAMAALSLCHRPVSGTEFIAAVVIGYDMARRALEACGAYEPHNEAGWHSTGTCGSFGAAAAAAYLLKLPAADMQSALGIAASTSSGVWAFIHDGAQTKRLHPGQAAAGGLMAALLAREKFSGPGLIFEDVWGGFTKTFAPHSADKAAWLNELGVNWKINRVSIKPYTSCRSTHAAIDAVALLLKEHDLKNSDIAAIVVELNSFVNGMCGGMDTTTMAGAQMSLPYGIAALLEYGSAGLNSYTQAMRSAPCVKRTLDKIKLVVNEQLPADDEPSITIIRHNGASYQKQVMIPLGSPANPLSEQELVGKYMAIAGLVWPKEIAAQLANLVLSLEDVTDMQEVLQIMQTGASTSVIIN